MNYLITVLGIVIGIGLIIVLFGSFLTFDQLVGLEYNSHRAQWEKDGKPRGFFWFPREYWRSQNVGWFNNWKSQYASNWTMQRNHFIWLFSTPEWMKQDEGAQKLVKRFRVLVLIWNGSFLGIILMLFRVYR